MKQPAKIDVAVLLLFFNRPQTFRRLFDEVRKARPSKLFLYQDGSRGERDLAGMEECRKIAEDIDWQCEVHRKYQERNYGCDPSNYMSQKWAFSMVDKCIVLEDDDVPSQSFFRFCKEMLDRYENDTRITMITGFNPDEVTMGVPYDYLFSSAFSIWGWASWRRVVDQWDGDYTFLDDSYNMSQLESLIKKRRLRRNFTKICQDHRATGKQYYESIFRACMLFNSGLAIVPTRNLINNIGLTDGSTHYAANFKTLPRRLRRMFTMKRHELNFPLKHPRYVIENVDYKEHFYKVNGWGYPLTKIGRSLEELFLNLRYCNFSAIARAIRQRVKKWTGSYQHT